MRNKNRPFFYEEKRRKSPNGLLFLSIVFIGFILWGFRVPRVRQHIAEPLWACASWCINGAKDVVKLTRRGTITPAQQTQSTPCPTLELPDRQVLFADNLTGISQDQIADPLADLRQTPTASPYGKVAEWEYLDPELNYQINGKSVQEEDKTQQIELIPPVEERADLYNDGSAALSAMLRFWGNTEENQYHIAESIHPETRDPSIYTEDIETYIKETYPDYQFLSRLNGSKDTLIRLLEQGVPVLLRLQRKLPYAFWPGDDHFSQHYIFLYGYNSAEDRFLVQDPSAGRSTSYSAEELLALWYPFQRSYLLIYPEEVDLQVQTALLEDYYEELNLQHAGTKFKTDCEQLPENPYAHYNNGVILYRQEHWDEAWECFNNAIKLGLPQRYFNYQAEVFETALKFGYADEINELTKPLLSRNRWDDMLLTYQGWAEYLRGNTKEAEALLSRAEKIAPTNPTLQYALRYMEQ